MEGDGGFGRTIDLAIGEDDLTALRAIARSRTEQANWVERARMLLAYRDDSSFFAAGRRTGVHHQTVQRCVERAVAYGPLRRARHLQRPGRARRSPPRPRRGSRISPAARPRNWATLTNRGRRDFLPAMCARTVRGRARPALPHREGTLCNILNEREKSPTGSAITWNAATRSSSKRWQRSCASIARSSSSKRWRRPERKS